MIKEENYHRYSFKIYISQRALCVAKNLAVESIENTLRLLCLYVQDSRNIENATQDLRIAISIGRKTSSLTAAILNKAEGR